MKNLILYTVALLLIACSKQDQCAHCTRTSQTIWTDTTLANATVTVNRTFCGKADEVEERANGFVIDGNSTTYWPGFVMIRTAQCTTVPD